MFSQAKFFGSLEKAGGTSESDHVVFLGLHNADAFRAKIEHWLPRLDMQGAVLLLSDNASTDSTLEWIVPLVESLGMKHSVTRNPKNLGGYGNLASNLGAMGEVRWVTTLHQDDAYQPGHIQAHRKVLKTASYNLGMVFSEARSVDQNGRMIPFPRGHWLLVGKSDPVTVFLAHLRHHVYPFSGATFAMEVLKRFPVPYDSTAFPDTEIVMKMLVDFEVAQAEGVSVDYLENPKSESHALDSTSRDIGSYQALIRVFSHPSFDEMCQKLPADKLPKFLRALASGIDLRLSDKSLASLLRQAVMEIALGNLKSRGARLSEGFGQHDPMKSEAINLKIFEMRETKMTPRSERDRSVQFNLTNSLNEVLRKNLVALASPIPRSMRRLLFVQMMSTSAGKRLFPQWNFDWDQS